MGFSILLSEFVFHSQPDVNAAENTKNTSIYTTFGWETEWIPTSIIASDITIYMDKQ